MKYRGEHYRCGIFDRKKIVVADINMSEPYEQVKSLLLEKGCCFYEIGDAWGICKFDGSEYHLVKPVAFSHHPSFSRNFNISDVIQDLERHCGCMVTYDGEDILVSVANEHELGLILPISNMVMDSNAFTWTADFKLLNAKIYNEASFVGHNSPSNGLTYLMSDGEKVLLGNACLLDVRYHQYKDRYVRPYDISDIKSFRYGCRYKLA